MRNIFIIGIGMGNINTITVNGMRQIEESNVLIGAKRMTESFATPGKQVVCTIAPAEILSWIESHEDIQRGAVLMSGDLGFFSGANKLRKLIAEKYGSPSGNEVIKFEYIPGISSLSYLSAAIGIPWEDAKIVSLHGRSENSTAIVLNNEKTFFLTDSTENTVKNICSKLTEAHLGDVEIFVGEKLSYEDEKITKGTAQSLLEKDFESLSVMLVINAKALKSIRTGLGIDDDEFIRGNVPMTKEEVRTLALSKLRLEKTDIVYDIGAGTGSVSVEAALNCQYGRVFSIETNPEGIELIEKNRDKFNVKNLFVVNGMAPEALTALPTPDKAFIGGSKGNMDEIIKMLLLKNPNVRIVMDVVSLESLAEAVACIKNIDLFIQTSLR